MPTIHRRKKQGQIKKYCADTIYLKFKEIASPAHGGIVAAGQDAGSVVQEAWFLRAWDQPGSNLRIGDIATPIAGCSEGSVRESLAFPHLSGRDILRAVQLLLC